jgi:hypothetical protein
MSTHPSALSGADELLVHQHPDTFATVGSSDPAWTERVYARAGAHDGSIAVMFGMGRYLNRNVLDGFGAISVGATQYTVRASRALSPRPTDTDAGPLRYEVVEPLKSVRCVLEPNDVVPISFDVTVHGVGAPWTERDNDRRGYRLASDVTRYIQVGTAAGEMCVDGRNVALSSSSTFAVRDHSWGIRQHVGVPAPDHRDESQIPPGYRFMMTWAPALLTLPDGRHFQAHLAQWTAEGPGQNKVVTSARVIEPDGRQLRAVHVTTSHAFEPATRLAMGATIDCELEDGTARRFRIDAVGDTRSCLGPGLYYGFDGHYHGEYRGRLVVDGERLDNTADPAIQARIHRLRDVIAQVTEETTKATGWCGLQVEAVGAFPEYGLDEDYTR